jgi:endogenous inhibitor of DNA gyrase (YacG/DUF329 family)
MALIKCPDCGKDVSTEAAACPHCGRPIKLGTPAVAPPSPSTYKWTPGRLGCAAAAIIALLFFLFELMGGSSESTNPTATTAVPAPTPTVLQEAYRQTPSPSEKLAFSASQICRAGIGLIMGRDPKIIRAREAGGIVFLSYTRSDDATVWKYRCRLEGDRIIWASDPGRWRTHPDDEQLYFRVLPDSEARLQVEERYSDGSANQKTFSSGDLSG